jgi:hypothetical protein
MWVHCSIYKASYNVSNISYLKSPPPLLSPIPPLLISRTTPGNSLCSYLYLKLEKHHVFYFIFYIFFSTKLKDMRAKQVLCVWGEWSQREGGGGWESGRRMNMVQTMYINEK